MWLKSACARSGGDPGQHYAGRVHLIESAHKCFQIRLDPPFSLDSLDLLPQLSVGKPVETTNHETVFEMSSLTCVSTGILSTCAAASTGSSEVPKLTRKGEGQ